MTAEQRLERDLPQILGDLAVAPYPDYIDGVLATTAQRRQRPAWAFPERWLPMDIATERVPTARLPWRQLGVLALIALLLATALVVYVGSRPRVPQPFGIAANGAIVYGDDGDVLVRDEPGAVPRVLIGGPADDQSPDFSPDGRRFSFVRDVDGKVSLMTANADGTELRTIHEGPLHNPIRAWAPDSRSLALITESKGIPRLLIVNDGVPDVREITLPGITPTEVAWRPPAGDELLVRGLVGNGRVELYLVDTNGGTHKPLGLEVPVGPWAWFQLAGPTWSPDGSKLAYTVLVRDGSDTTVVRARTANADGTSVETLSGPMTPHIQEGWPSFSPDGATLAVHRWQWEGDGWLVAYRGERWRDVQDVGPRIAANGGNVDLIKAWSPDATRLIARTTNTEQIFSIDPLSGSYVTMDLSASTLPTWQRKAP